MRSLCLQFSLPWFFQAEATLGPIRLGTSRIASTGDTIRRFNQAA
jgi:hypothetical protein